MPLPNPLLRAQNVHRVLGAQDAATDILRGVSVSIGREYVSIVGASGSGKSTLLYLLGGLDRPTRLNPWDGGREYDPPSRILIDGQDTWALNDVALASLRNEKVGFVFQFHYLLKDFTAQENVALPMFKLGQLSRRAAMGRRTTCWTVSGWRTRPPAGPTASAAASSSGSRSRGPWPTSRPSCWRTSRRGTSTAATVNWWHRSSRS